MRYKRLPAEFYKENRHNLLTKVKKNSVVLLFGAHQMPRNGDQYFRYRQNSDFFYFTGIEQEKSILLIGNEGQSHQQILFIVKPDKDLETWEGHKITREEASEISGIENIRFIEDFDQVLHSISCSIDNFYFNIPENPKFKSEVKTRDFDMLDKYQSLYPTHRFLRLAPLIQEMRLIKSAPEIIALKEACRITGEAFIHVLKTISNGMAEYELEAGITYVFLKNGAAGHAYPPIVAQGKNACVLHYIENNMECKSGNMVLMDFGAEYANYAADLSRTIPVNRKYSKRQKELYESVLKVFKFAKHLMKPGTTINKIQKEVCRMWEEEHIRLGLYTKNDINDHQGENPLWFNYFMHGIGHFLGLDVHDPGSRDTILQPGMVLTCEPGIYIAEEQVGIRIENNILITPDGNEDLMADIPIEIEELESIMAK